MITPDQAYTALQQAKPDTATPVSGRPSAIDALHHARIGAEAELGRQLRSKRHHGPVSTRRGVLTAIIAFVLVVIVGLVATLLIADDPGVIDTPTPTTAPLVTPTPPPNAIDQATQGLIDQFVTTYNAGDVDALLSLMAPGMGKSTLIGFDGPILWDEETLRIQYAIETALKTDISLVDCDLLTEGRVSCQLQRVDDLVRVTATNPASDTRWRLGFGNGLLTEWGESRPDCPAYVYQARGVFVSWLAETHSEIPNPTLFACRANWRTDTGIELVIADLVVEWAASEGVALDD